MNLGITVCIATYNGSSKILDTINAILNNSIVPDEILVFIDGSKDETYEILKAYELNPIFTICNSITNFGRASARNRAARMAKNEILLFIDDDIIIPNNTIKSHLFLQEKFPDLVHVNPTLTVKSKNDFSNFKRFVELKWNNSKAQDGEVTFSAAFFSMRKSVFIKLGGFHDGLRDAEDYEFGRRLKENKVSVAANPDLVGLHNDQITCRSFIIRNRQYNDANKRLIEEKILNSNKYVSQKPKPIKRAFFALFTHNFVINLILFI